jgi:hypothetical protein
MVINDCTHVEELNLNCNLTHFLVWETIKEERPSLPVVFLQNLYTHVHRPSASRYPGVELNSAVKMYSLDLFCKATKEHI